MISQTNVIWIARQLGALVLSPFLLCCCSVEKNNSEESIIITIVNNDEIIDRGESLKVLFDITPSNYAFSEEEVSLYPSKVNNKLSLIGVDNLGNGRYSAIIDDKGLGQPYSFEIGLRISNSKQEVITSNDFRISYTPCEYDYSVLTNETIYNNNNHAAFTGLLNHNGTLYLAFREGSAHRPASMADYGVIKILVNDGSGWKESATIQDKTKDLRDPFLIEVDGTIRVYIGYNTFEGDRYQHSGSVCADFVDGKWSNVKPLFHDVSHIVWLWKVRKYADKYYSVAYLEGEYPALLSSNNGIDWETVTLFQLDGILSEADMAFIGKTIYVCLRKDQPIGSPSYWGVAIYPFKEFTWKEMNTCVESPELLRMPFSNSILIAGRERHPSSDEVSTTLFSSTLSGDLTKIATFETGIGFDTGYPGLVEMNEMLYCSYYTGIGIGAQIKLSKLSIKQK